MINNMVLSDMAAMKRVRERIAEEQAVKERAASMQGENIQKPIPSSEEIIGLSHVAANQTRQKAY